MRNGWSAGICDVLVAWRVRVWACYSGDCAGVIGGFVGTGLDHVSSAKGGHGIQELLEAAEDSLGNH